MGYFIVIVCDLTFCTSLSIFINQYHPTKPHRTHRNNIYFYAPPSRTVFWKSCPIKVVCVCVSETALHSI